MGGRLVILDVADPLAPSLRRWLRRDSLDTVVSADSPRACEWLASVAGVDVQSASRLRSVSGMQGSVEEYARGTCAGLHWMYRDVDVGPSIEYGLVLAAVGALRDLDVCDHVSRLRRSGATWSQAVLLTDRRRTRGLVECMERAAGASGTVVVHRPQRRYLDATLEASRPIRRLLRHRVGAHTRPGHSSAGGQAVAVVQRLARMLEDPDRAPTGFPIVHLPDAVGDLLLEYLAGQGLWRWSRLQRAARHSASEVCTSAAAYLAGMQDCLTPADVNHLCRDYVYPLCVSSLMRGVLGIEAVLSRASTCDLSGLLVWNDVLPHSRGMVDAANVLGLRTGMLQHGVFGLRTLHDRPRVDVVAVWGELSGQWLEAGGFPKERVRLVGAPGIVVESRHDIPSPSNAAPSLLYTSQPYVGMTTLEDVTEPMRTLHMVAEAGAAAGWAVLAKAHPIEGGRTWGSSVHGGSVRICLSAPMADLVKDADAMVSRTSTSVLEALLGDLPVIAIDDAGDRWQDPYTGVVGIRRVSSARGLTETLCDLGSGGRGAEARSVSGSHMVLSDLVCAHGSEARAHLRSFVAQELCNRER
jgi:hypothetical protein